MTKPKPYDVAIIGAGASGCIAAITTAHRKKSVLLIEKNSKIGRKILVTGNGRCNISNENVTQDYRKPIHYHGENPKFVQSTLNQFGLEDTKKFFQELGIEFTEEDNGRLFPTSQQAESVVDVLDYEIKQLDIKTAYHNSVKSISSPLMQGEGAAPARPLGAGEGGREYKNKAEAPLPLGEDVRRTGEGNKRVNSEDSNPPLRSKWRGAGGEVNYHITLQDGRKFEAKNLVIATGGKTYPGTGSTGDGYEFAKQFRHSIINTFPAYTGLVIKPNQNSKPVGTSDRLVLSDNNKKQIKKSTTFCHKLQGVKMEVSVTVGTGRDLSLQPGKTGKGGLENTGTIMFTHYGLSAPVVLEISREIAKYFNENPDQQIIVKINFLPQLHKHEVEKFLINRWQKMPTKTLNFSLTGLLPNKIFPTILEAEDVNGKMKVSEVTKELRQKIVNWLTEYPIVISRVRDMKEAHFTAGGVNTKEINPRTLESKIHPGLYFCGEVLDIDGDCGGYNLQWAWSSGAVVGMSV